MNVMLDSIIMEFRGNSGIIIMRSRYMSLTVRTDLLRSAMMLMGPGKITSVIPLYICIYTIVLSSAGEGVKCMFVGDTS